MATNNHGKQYINSRGEPVMRITQVIKTLAKDQLLIWANMLGFKKVSYKGELERTANIGTMVHAIIEDFADDTTVTELDRYDEFGIYSHGDKEEVTNAIVSFFRWYDDNKELYHVVDTEVVLIGDEVGGTADVLLQSPWHSDRILIGDYKTSKSVYFTMFLQLAGYIWLYEELNGPDTCDGAVVFQLDKKYGKKAKPVYIRRGEMEPYIQCFRSLLSVAIQTSSLEKRFGNSINPYNTKFIL